MTEGVTTTYTDLIPQFSPGNLSQGNLSHINSSLEDYGQYQFAEEFNTSAHYYLGDIHRPPSWEITIKVLCYAIIMILSLVGNSLVVYIVWRTKRMRTTTNFFIVNLAVSDLMVTSSCTWVHLVDDLTEGWVLGAFFCKVNSFAQVLSLVSSILTLTLISCDRFFGIVFAMKAHMTSHRSPFVLLLIWVCALALSSPLLLYREQHERSWRNHTEIWCADTWPTKRTIDPVTLVPHVSTPSRTIYYTFISGVLFFLPVAVMTFAYSVIIWKLWSARLPGEQIECEVRAQDKMKKRVIGMLITLLVVFTLCWLPFQIAVLYSEHRKNKILPLPEWYGKFYFFANFIAYSNSAFNPIIYTGFNENFRQGFKMAMGCRRRKKTYNSISRMTRDTSVCHVENNLGQTKI